MASKNKSVRLDEELWERLEARAKEDAVRVNTVIKEAVAAYLDGETKSSPAPTASVTVEATLPPRTSAYATPVQPPEPGEWRGRGKDFSKSAQAGRKKKDG